MNTQNYLTKEMKNALFNKMARYKVPLYPCDVEQIDWNVFIFHYPTGWKQLKTLLRWKQEYPSVDSIERLEYGIYLITSCEEVYFVDTRRRYDTALCHIVSHEKFSDNVYVLGIQRSDKWENKQYMFYNLYWELIPQCRSHRKSLNQYRVFETYRKLEGSLYILDEDTEDETFYDLDSNTDIPILEYTSLEEGLYVLTMNPEKSEEYTKSSYKEQYRLYHLNSGAVSKTFTSYKRAGRLLLLKTDHFDYIIFDSITGNQNPTRLYHFDFESFEEMDDHTVFKQKSGAICKIPFQTLEFGGWKFY